MRCLKQGCRGGDALWKESEGDVKGSSVGVLNDELREGFGDAQNADFGEQGECRDVVVRYGAENKLCEG